MKYSGPFTPANILLPDFSKVNPTKYSVIACDQFTSEPSYWHDVEKLVGNAPSTYHQILPESFLGETSKINDIHKNMETALVEDLHETKDIFVYVERKQTDGRIRHGLVGKIDLECYEYTKGSKAQIRATEATVLERVPPRMLIRHGAPIEYPHVMLLLNDPNLSVIEPLKDKKLKKLYDFDLMMEGGHITGYEVSGKEVEEIENTLSALSEKQDFLYAIGDGNHSLAAAKMHYDVLKAECKIDREDHPARYALAELVNLYDEAIEFSPIYRAVFHVDKENFLKELYKICDTGDGKQTFTLINEGDKTYSFKEPTHPLTVGTLQNFLDEYVKVHPDVKVDYIHDETSLRNVCKEQNTIGFLFDVLKKEELFSAVDVGGVLPRKTFSIGTARDKRYYLEGRKIQ